jgi:hypothetical protein
VKAKPQREPPLKIDISFEEAMGRAVKVKPPLEGWLTYERKLKGKLERKPNARKSKKAHS